MDDKSLYAAILGVKEPWAVEKVELRLVDGEVHVWVALPKDTVWGCPECQAAASTGDKQPVPHLGIDETAFARRHQYVSVVTDLDRSRVL